MCVLDNSDCYIVKAVAQHAILHGHMTSPLGRSALYCGLQFKFDTGRLLDPRFDYCNLVWNNYLSNILAEMLSLVLKDFLLFRGNPKLCSDVSLIRTTLHVLSRVHTPADFLNRFVIGFYFCFFLCLYVCSFSCTLCTIQ